MFAIVVVEYRSVIGGEHTRVLVTKGKFARRRMEVDEFGGKEREEEKGKKGTKGDDWTTHWLTLHN